MAREVQRQFVVFKVVDGVVHFQDVRTAVRGLRIQWTVKPHKASRWSFRMMAERMAQDHDGAEVGELVVSLEGPGLGSAGPRDCRVCGGLGAKTVGPPGNCPACKGSGGLK